MADKINGFQPLNLDTFFKQAITSTSANSPITPEFSLPIESSNSNLQYDSFSITPPQEPPPDMSIGQNLDYYA